ncbi:hypothetical protein M0805_005990 [Coniferiporia weirii]|nr:hypothetical protein M0805_005990 [Coniferiporia weirii]
MSIRRRSTVHDLASLRLHPDGSRVQISVRNDGTGRSGDSVGARAVTARLARYITRDAQGNLIARDAGGLGLVKQRKNAKGAKAAEGKGKGKEVAAEDEENFDQDINAGESSRQRQDSATTEVDEEDDKSDESREDGVKDTRAKKRRKFYHDFSFLDALHPNSPTASVFPTTDDAGPSSGIVTQNEAGNPQVVLPIPSSELLKGIHYFASEYYSASGCLFDAAKEARRQRKARKVNALRKRVSLGSGQRLVDNLDFDIDPDRNSRHEGDSDSEIGGSNEDSDASEGNEEVLRRNKRGTGRLKRSKEPPQRDMYKAFDGSALMAIGMFLQEYIVQMMSALPSEEWERQMLAHDADENRGKEKKIVQKGENTSDGIMDDGIQSREMVQGEAGPIEEVVGEEGPADGNDNHERRSLGALSSEEDSDD